MDSILDMCYRERLFQLPNLSRAKYVPTHSAYKYCKQVGLILETDRVTHDELVELCCRKTFQVKSKSIYTGENDVLYSIYAIHAGQNPQFMRTWLKLYADMYKWQFMTVGEEYLNRKKLTFDLWRESIKDGRKGDVLVLLGLNYLMGSHTMVHLHGNRLWSTLQEKLNHDEMVSKCDFHLVYLGRGIFAELCKRAEPLVEIEGDPNVMSLVVGTLTSTEQIVINKLSKLGLGFAVDRTSTKDNKPGTSSTPSDLSHEVICPELVDQKNKEKGTVDTTSALIKVQHLADIPSATISVEQLKLALTDRVLVTPEVIDSLPSTRLLTPMSEKHYINKVIPCRYNLRSKARLRKEDYSLREESTYSGSTELYWSHDEENVDKGSEDQLTQPRAMKKKAQFKYRIHGIKQSKRKYNLRCVVAACNKVSYSVRAWNSHYRITHKKRLKCNSCPKLCATPSSLRDHRTHHRAATHRCPNCALMFVYKSAMQLHRIVHSKHKLFKCFAGNCNASYKWRQDLHRHIQRHLQIVHRCRLCEYSSSEARLVRRHQRVHKDVYKYYCMNYPQCPFKTKYWTSNHRHKFNCKYL